MKILKNVSFICLLFLVSCGKEIEDDRENCLSRAAVVLRCQADRSAQRAFSTQVQLDNDKNFCEGKYNLTGCQDYRGYQ